MRRITLPLAALLLIAVTALPLAAQSGPEASVEADPYADFVAVFESSVDNPALLLRALDEVGEALRTGNPDVAAMEAQYPGAVDQLLAAMTPMLSQHSQNIRGQFQRELAVLLREHLTPAEAGAAATFYASPIGRRVMASIEGNMRFDALIDEAVATDGLADISTEAIDRDLRRTQAAAVADVSSADMAEMNRMARNATWLPKLAQLRPQILTLRTAAENAPMDPELEAAMGDAILAVVERITAQDPPKQQPVRRK